MIHVGDGGFIWALCCCCYLQYIWRKARFRSSTWLRFWQFNHWHGSNGSDFVIQWKKNSKRIQRIPDFGRLKINVTSIKLIFFLNQCKLNLGSHMNNSLLKVQVSFSNNFHIVSIYLRRESNDDSWQMNHCIVLITIRRNFRIYLWKTTLSHLTTNINSKIHEK